MCVEIAISRWNESQKRAGPEPKESRNCCRMCSEISVLELGSVGPAKKTTRFLNLWRVPCRIRRFARRERKISRTGYSRLSLISTAYYYYYYYNSIVVIQFEHFESNDKSLLSNNNSANFWILHT